MKKLFALLLAVVMVMGLVACVNTPAESTPTAGKDNPGVENPSSTYEGVKFPLAEEKTFKITASGDSEMWIDEGLANNKLWQEIYQKTNVKIEFNWITVLDKADRLAALDRMMQTNQVGDAVLCSFMDDASISGLVANDKILAITEYVDNEILMPNLHKNVFGSEPGVRGNWTFPDGEVYVLGNYTLGVETDSRFYINKVWLDKAGMEVPTTWAQFEAALKYFAENDMNGNGKDDEIPFFVHTSQNYSLPSHWMSCWGISCKDSTTDSYTYIMDDGETVDYVPLTDNYKAMVTKFAEWYENGILFDGFDLDKTAVNELYRGTGDSLIGVMPYQGSGIPRNGDEYVWFCPPAADGYELEIYNHPALKYGGKNNAFLMKDCSDPETLLAWFDLFYDEEVSVRNKYGELDGSYVTLDENGKLTGVSATAKDPDWLQANKKTDNYLGLLLQSLPYCYTENTYETIFAPNMGENIDKIMELYGEHLNPTPWPRPYFSEDDSKLVAEVRADVNTLTAKWYAEFVTGEKNIETDWAAYLDAMNKAGIDQYLEGHQNAYDNWLSGQK